jgi:tRNA 2-thiouridine synthesizing protein B
MSTLHIFSKPLSYYNVERLNNIIKVDDKVLLVGDACYANMQFKQLSNALILLEEDVNARSITYASNDTVITYQEFVELCLISNQSITW